MNSARSLIGSQVNTLLAVTNSTDEKIASLLTPLGFRVAKNSDADQGMGSSLKVGLSNLADAKAVLVYLADMPDIRHSTLHSILSCYSETNGLKFIVPTYRGKNGNPVLIPQCFYSKFEQSNSDVGARHIIKREPQYVHTCSVDDPAVLIDYDTPEQLSAAGWLPPLEA